MMSVDSEEQTFSSLSSPRSTECALHCGHDDRGLYLTVNRYGRSKPPFSGLCLRMNRGKSQGMALLANKRLFDIF